MAAPMGAANLGGVADPRLNSIVVDDIGTRRDSLIHHIGPPDTNGHNTIYLDSSITFEDYNWWAKRAREFEKSIPANAGFTSLMQVIGLGASNKKTEAHPDVPHSDSDKDITNEKDVPKDAGSGDADLSRGGDDKPPPYAKPPTGTSTPDNYGAVTEAEWAQAQRAGRTASWGAIFYLITTDILGPYSAPWAIAQLGFGPGVAIFIVFGVLSYYSAMQLWKMYCGLDSPRYPIRNYGDLAFRLFGNWARITANVLQSFQFFLNVALCIVANGQALAQMAAGKYNTGFLCFIVAEVIFTIIGLVLGQIRTLQRLGWLANLSVWLNVTVMITTLVAVYLYAPNYAANATLGIPKGPIVTSGGLPPGKSLQVNVSGVFNGVFAFGGATMFMELLAEMRRPFDFWKAVLIAEAFITSVYMIFGLIVYSRQGQFTYNPTFQGISNTGYAFQTVGNALYFVVSVVAALLYGNIGMKVLYTSVLQDVFRFPPLDKKKGKWTWVVMVPIYWLLAFILAAAVPQISNLTAFEGALTIQQFSYTFPPLLMVAYNCQADSALPEERYDPRTGQTIRLDNGPRRWWRGFKKRLLMNTWDSLYFLAAGATAILGLWASISGMVAFYKVTKVTSFGCTNPAGS